MHAPSRSISVSTSISQPYYLDKRSAIYSPSYAGIIGKELGLDQQDEPRNLAVAAASTAYKSDLQRRGSLVVNSGSSFIAPSAFPSAPPSEFGYNATQKSYGTDDGTETERGTVSTGNCRSIITEAVGESHASASLAIRFQSPPHSRQASIRPPGSDVSASARPSFDDGARQPSSYKRIKKARSVMIVTTPTVRSTAKRTLRAPKSESFLRGGQDYMPESLKKQLEKKNAKPRLYRKASLFLQKIPSRKPSLAVIGSNQSTLVSGSQVKQSKDSFRAIKKMGGTIIRSVRKKLGIQKPSRKPLEVPVQHVISSREHYTTNPEDTSRHGFEIDREALASSTISSVDPLFSRLAYDVAKEIPNTTRSVSPISGQTEGIRTSAANTWNTSAIMGTAGCNYQQRLSVIPEKRSSIPQAETIFADETPNTQECTGIPSHEQALASLLEDVAKRRKKMGLDDEDVVGKTRGPPELADIRKRLAQSSTSSRRTHERHLSSFGTVLAAGSRKSSYSWSINDSTPRARNNSPIVPGELEEQLSKLTQATSKVSLYPSAENTQHATIQHSTIEPINRPTSSIYSRSTNGRSVSPERRPCHQQIASPVPFDNGSTTRVNHLDFASTQNFWTALEESSTKPIPSSPERGNRLKVKRRNIYYYDVDGLAGIKNNENENIRSQTPKSRIPMAKASLATLRERTNDSGLTIKGSTSVTSFKTEVSYKKPMPLGRRVAAENEMHNSDSKNGYIGMRCRGENENMGSVRFL